MRSGGDRDRRRDGGAVSNPGGGVFRCLVLKWGVRNIPQKISMILINGLVCVARRATNRASPTRLARDFLGAPVVAAMVGGVDGEDVVAKPFGSPLGGLHRRVPYGRLYPT